MTTQFWLAEVDTYGNPALIDGAHPARSGAEKALVLYERLPMIDTKGKRYMIAEVHLNEPVGYHGVLNETALKALGG